MGSGSPEFIFDDSPARAGDPITPRIPEENYWFQRHVAAYHLVAGQIRGLRVLDAGCGESYGAEILAASAAEVVSADLERSVVERAAPPRPGARFEAADLQALHVGAASFEAVVALGVIEHMRSPADFCGEVARILKPGGLAIFATPNRLTCSPEGIRNPLHTVEFSPAEFRSLLERTFVVEQLLGMFHSGSIRRYELTARASMPERLIKTPAPQWSPRLRAAVARVTSKDFRFSPDHVDRSLDLVAIARRAS